jgi:hypothetical protein
VNAGRFTLDRAVDPYKSELNNANDIRLAHPEIIPCECGKVYIGQGGRSIQIRVKEHEKHIILAQESALSSHPYNIQYNGYQRCFPWVNQPWHGVDHPPPSSTEVKNEYSCTSVPLMCLHGLFWGHLLPVEAVTMTTGLKTEELFRS